MERLSWSLVYHIVCICNRLDFVLNINVTNAKEQYQPFKAWQNCVYSHASKSQETANAAKPHALCGTY
jgi:hypothetical protein